MHLENKFRELDKLYLGCQPSKICETLFPRLSRTIREKFIWCIRGAIMLAILVQKGTKYACYFSFDRDHICLQSRIFSNSFLTQDDHFQGVFKIFEIAGIYGLYRNWNWSHIWFPFEPRLQAYTVSYMIYGPYPDWDCRHIWPLLEPNCKHNRSPLYYFFIVWRHRVFLIFLHAFSCFTYRMTCFVLK